jgi:hypothetical protein
VEIPYSREMVDGFWLAIGGAIHSAGSALLGRIGCNIGGGFQHASPGRRKALRESSMMIVTRVGV